MRSALGLQDSPQTHVSFACFAYVPPVLGSETGSACAMGLCKVATNTHLFVIPNFFVLKIAVHMLEAISRVIQPCTYALAIDAAACVVRRSSRGDR